MTIELAHVGEALITEMLSRLSARGQLDRVCCAATGTTLASELDTASPQFLADQALIKVHSPQQTYSCDGAQTVDVLCVGEQRAVAMEAKLGETRMSRTEFPKRFCGQCGISGHTDPRLTGNMIAVLDRLLPFANGRVFATVGNRSWPLSEHWWLVVRECVWKHWATQLPVRLARILVFERLAQLLCRTSCEFDDLVLQVVGNGFANRWNIRFDEQ